MTGGVGDDWVRGDTNQDKYFGDVGRRHGQLRDRDPARARTRPRTASSVDLAGRHRPRRRLPGAAVAGVENVIGSLFEDSPRRRPARGYVRGLGGGDDCNGFVSATCRPPRSAPRRSSTSRTPTAPTRASWSSAAAARDNLTVNQTAGALAGHRARPRPGPGCTADGGGVTCARPGAEFGYILLWGGDGNDTLSVGSGIAPTTGVKGDGGPGDDVLNGGPAADVLFPGESGSDRLAGGAGDDALAGRPGGGDTLVGGPGNDNLATDDACAGHTYDGGPGGADVAGFAQAGEGAGVSATLGGIRRPPGRRRVLAHQDQRRSRCWRARATATSSAATAASTW